MWNSVLLAMVLSAPSAAQIPAGRIRIPGSIAKAGSLSLGPSDNGTVALQALREANSTQVQVRLRPSSTARTITVPLIARSNAGYRLLVKSVQPVRVVLKSVDPNAGTMHLTSDATAVRAIEAQLTGALDEVAIIAGPRISSGGNNATLDNAIRFSLEVELPQSISEADLTFTMEFEN
jgi:hypothetical protein